mgnify:CR=1 FL=1
MHLMIWKWTSPAPPLQIHRKLTGNSTVYLRYPREIPVNNKPLGEFYQGLPLIHCQPKPWNVMKPRANNMNKTSRELSLFCDMNISVNTREYRLTTDGKAIILSAENIFHYFPLFGAMNANPFYHGYSLKGFHDFLCNNNLTLCVQNRRMGILGQRARGILHYLTRIIWKVSSRWVVRI